MNAAICTLFEGQYHYGVAALSNSLYKQGFRGDIFVGYRGGLPNWVLSGKVESIGKWSKATTLNTAEGLKLIFLPLETNYSLTNYKPNFMEELWEGPAKEADAFFYFDPDIVIDEPWSCFEEWISCGVALCEDVNSPLQEYHPRRQGWKKYFKGYGIDLFYKNQIYVNGGFIGVLKKDRSFLKLWIQVQNYMGDAIGGLENSIFSNQTYNSTIAKRDGFQIFDKSDQDALNIAIEAFGDNVSYLGKEGMGFVAGKATMFHALGANKPWNVNFLKKAFFGRSPRPVDDCYWRNSSSPIMVHPKSSIIRKQASKKISKFICRFYKI
ncbi:hypothetical protein FFWV33_12090 [Flavobacterium faecale]|uniref:Glycosyl transferase n=1 Tax=Flavobacterium faecale TaxID=1355330 RepID=A0A2S1LEW0_9FLAO|nr:hypothetical protein [Flavobacterium faecale]AWG22201.1 hypothetical protein FFWV33_12090 [Flavobacterium faecale]